MLGVTVAVTVVMRIGKVSPNISGAALTDVVHVFRTASKIFSLNGKRRPDRGVKERAEYRDDGDYAQEQMVASRSSHISMTESMSVAANLEALLSGALNARDFRRKYEFGSHSVVLNAIWDHLHARDESYRDMQDNELRKLIQLLREDAPVSQLRRINFLGARWPG